MLHFIKLPFVIRICVLSILEWPPTTGFTVYFLETISFSILYALDDDCQSWRGVRWLSGRVLDLELRGYGVEPYRRHCIVSLSKATFVFCLALVLNQEDSS